MEETERKPTLENFLAGTPLNAQMEELAREVTMEEEEAAAAQEKLAAADPFDPKRPLDDGDRKELLKLTQSAGWEVYQRIRLRACAEAEKAATLLSQENPLANQQRIAEGWAYLAVMRQVIKAEAAMIEAEIEQFKPKRRRKGSMQ